MNLKLERSGPWIGAVGLVVMLWLVFTTAFYFFVPWWGFLLHVVVWASFVPLLVSWSRTRPARCIWIPALAFVGWCVVNAFGVIVLGWD